DRLGQSNIRELSECRQPIASRGKLLAHFILRQMPRPTDHGRHADASFEEGIFSAAVWAGISTAAEGADFDGMALVGHEADDGVLAQVKFVELRENIADAFVGGRYARGVHVARARE